MKSILTFVGAYLPGYKAGGPLRSISNLVEQLGDEYDFRIVTADRDRGDSAAYPGLDDGAWHPVGKAQVRYLRPDEMRLRIIARLMRETPHDVLYLNSFFSPVFATRPLLAMRLGLSPRKPVILAPRGEFSKGALTIRPRKKRAFMAASRLLGLHETAYWQATTEFEADDIIREIGPKARNRIHVAQNLPRASGAPPAPRDRMPADPLHLVFLSRIVPKKNLLFALEALCDVKVPVRFTIMGPKEDKGYWQACQKVIRKLPSHVEIVETGPIAADDVSKYLSEHDLFFFPTLGENYGHVISEAFQAGLPVLTSDQTPWRDLAAEGVGQDLELNQKQGFVDYIHAMSALSDFQRNELRRKCWEYARRRTKPELVLSAYRDMFDVLCRNES